MTIIRTLYLFALAALTLWVATATTRLFADEYPLIACESDKVIVAIDQPQCTPQPPTAPTFGPLGLGLEGCGDPLAWVPDGQRIKIQLKLSAEHE